MDHKKVTFERNIKFELIFAQITSQVLTTLCLEQFGLILPVLSPSEAGPRNFAKTNSFRYKSKKHPIKSKQG